MFARPRIATLPLLAITLAASITVGATSLPLSQLPSARERCARLKASFDPLVQRIKSDAPQLVVGDWKLGRAIDLLGQLPEHSPDARPAIEAFFADGLELTAERLGDLDFAMSASSCPIGQETSMWRATIEGAKLARVSPKLRARLAAVAKTRWRSGDQLPPTLAAVRSTIENARLAIDARILKAPREDANQRLNELHKETIEAAAGAQREFAAAFPQARPSGADAPEAQSWGEATSGGNFARAKAALKTEFENALRLRSATTELLASYEAAKDEKKGKKPSRHAR